MALWFKGLHQLLPRAQRLPWARLSTWAALILFCYSLAQLTWTLVPRPQPEPPQASGTESTAHPSRPPTQALAREIGRWHLFGTTESRPAPKPESSAQAPTTGLNLKLSGILASDNPDHARAIISAGGQQERFYALGDLVSPGAKLVEIQTTQVILERNGRLESLPLEKAKLTGGGIRRPSPNTRKPTRTKRRQRTLRDYRDDLLKDPMSVAKLVRPTPHYEKGKLAGFRLNPTKDRHLLRRHGITRRDVVTAVNGVPMNDPIRGLQIMKNLATTDTIQLTLKRNGKERNVTISFTE